MKVNQLPLEVGTRFEQIFHRERRGCTCEMPMVSRKWNEALGTLVDIRLCCMAKAVEKLTGQKLYEVFDFRPRWEWDCETVEERQRPDGTVEQTIKGPPPKWLRERMEKKGVPIHNLPE